MIEDKKSRTVLLCVDLRDGQLHIANAHRDPDPGAVQLIPFRSISRVRGQSLDCIISTPAARGDARYGRAVEEMAPALALAGRRRR